MWKAWRTRRHTIKALNVPWRDNISIRLNWKTGDVTRNEISGEGAKKSRKNFTLSIFAKASVIVARLPWDFQHAPVTRQANFPLALHLDRDSINAAWKRTRPEIIYCPWTRASSFHHHSRLWTEDGSSSRGRFRLIFSRCEKEEKAAVVFEDNPSCSHPFSHSRWRALY